MRSLYKILFAALFVFMLQNRSTAQTTLAAGDIAFTGYVGANNTPTPDEFSFVLLAPVTTNTVINFTDNGWLSTNVFRTGEQTVTWTATAPLAAGTEIKIAGLTATLVGGGSGGTVTGTALSLSNNGDQILAYQGSAASPTFISAIHMNVYDVAIGDPVTTTAAAWDGTANTTNGSALPTGLTTGVNCIWIGTQAVFTSEKDNSRFTGCALPLGTAAQVRSAVNNQTNWTSTDGTPPGFTLPTACSYITAVPAPTFTLNPVSTSVCEGANASFTITATNATNYQWQVDNGGGFANITNNATYSGATATTLNITAVTNAMNGYLYRCVASNGSGSTNSTNGTLTVTPLPVNPTLLAKTPATITVADGTPVSATFNAGSGGTGCTDDFRYSTDGGATYLPYTPGSNISTTGLAAGSGSVLIEGRRANCSSGCQNSYVPLASWIVTPLPAGATTLNAGDIAFSAYSATIDEFSFVLLRNVGPGTVINFTNNGWLSTNVFRTGEETVTWTAPAGGLIAGTEIRIAGLTATKAGGGAAGTVSGTALGLSINGDQILAYRGTPAAPTFISAIHMNLFSTLFGDAVTTTAAVWDGTNNSINGSALPTGLTTGLNAIWIGTQDVPASEFENSRYGTCALPATLGPIGGLRAALNNQANWTSDNNAVPSFAIPTNCNYLGTQVPTVTVTGTPLAAFSTCSGSPSAEQNFTVSGSALTGDITITAPAGFEVSTTSGVGFASSLTLTPVSGGVANTTIYVRLSSSATGTPAGNITVASPGVTTTNIAVSGTVTLAPTPAAAGADAAVCGLGYTLQGNAAATGTGTWTQTAGPGTATFTNANDPLSPVTVTLEGTYTFRWSITNAPCPASTDDVDISFSVVPSVANAGTDKLVCTASPVATMDATAPTAGTGTWTQASGPATASILQPLNRLSPIGGLNTPGVYAFVWTISSGSCPSSTDTVLITVNPSPATPVITGGGVTVCQGTAVTLSGPVDPNYTYQWQRRLGTEAFSTVGTNPTYSVINSGFYQLVVTNQFGCSATSAATNVTMADYSFSGSLATGDAQQTGRLNRFAQVSNCAAPKACPGTFTTTGARLYDSYQVVNNTAAPVCATVGIQSGCGTAIFCAAYLNSYNPTNLCQNYLGDGGSSFVTQGYYEVVVPASSTLVLVVHEVNTGTGCANYTVTVNMPRDPSAITVNPQSPVCSGTPLTITGAIADTYAWTPGGGTTQAINVTPVATTQYNVTYGYGNNGCTGQDSVTVVVNALPTTALAGNDTAVCGTVITLAANTPVVGTGTWTQVSGPGTVNFSNANDPAATATASVNGVYTLRWTIATGAPCINTSADDVDVNFAATPSIANAGADKTACISPGSVAMTATAPTTGTGLWTQVAGPSTAVIVNATSPTTNIVNLSGIGTYTFRWTVSNAPCASNFDDVDVVVNGNPAAFTLAGGGTFCPSDRLLTGPANPNYTYVWERSLSGIANPNSFTAFGGTAQTQVVNSSGNYRLVVTNQFGCTASDTASVSLADYVFNGSLGAGDLQQTGRINRFGVVSTCAAPKACPGTFTTTGARFYDAYTITNPRNVPVCATIGIASGCGVNMFSVAYSGSFNPASTCTNYLADPGSSFPNAGYYEATIPANGTIVVVVHEVNTGAGCANYQLTVDVPRDGSPITVVPASVPCNSTATLTAPVAATYLWTPGGATTQSITTPPLFTSTQYKVTLGYGNAGCTREDSATVTVTSVAPTVVCPANITLGNSTGQCGRAVTYTTTTGGLPAPTVTYAFTGATTGSGAGDGSGSFFNVGTTQVTVTVTNACGSSNCSFTVTINDTEPPTVTTGSIGSCYATIAAAQAAALAATSATDNCPGALTEVASTVGTCSAVITVTTTDAAGNFTSVTYNTRIDNTPPTVTAGSIGSCYPTIAAAEAAALAATSATDNCPGALIETASTVGTCSAVITVTTTDACGNSTSVTYNTRIDNTPPTVTTGSIGSCYATVAAAEAAALAATSATDNCPGAVTETVSTVGTCSAVITVTTTDACGNSTSVTYNTRIDNTPPVITCPAAVTVSCDIAVPAPDISAVTVTDNCPGAITVTHIGDVISNQSCANRYTITRTYRATDGCGNFSECTQIITVDDQTPPVLNCPAPITVCGPAAVPLPDISTVTGVSDNCGGQVIVTFVSDVNNCPSCVNVPYTITRTYRATDACGNFTDCTQIITVNPIPTVNAVSNLTVCNGAGSTPISFSGAVAGTVYNWVNNNPTIGLGASGSGNIPSFIATNTSGSPVTATITVTPSFTNAGQTCTGTPVNFTITINPTPTVNTVGSQTVCAGSPTAAVNFSGTVAGTVFNWTNSNTSIGIAANGTGAIPSFTATNTGTTVQTATITVTPVFTNNSTSCTGTPRIFTITVNPVPVVNAITNNTYCEGSTVPSVVFGSPVAGVTYSWTRTAGPIGLAATSGTGNIPSFTAATTGSVPLTVTFSVSATFTNNGVSCPGPARQFTITVNPTPTVNTVANRTVCDGSNMPQIVFTSNVPGVVFNWTRTNQAIGLAATSGTGNVPSYTATNTGTTPLVSTFTVTASFTNNGVTCTSAPVTFTVTVNPLPVVSFALPFDTLYQNPGVIQLTGGSPTGGIYSGVGISSQGLVNPAALSQGNYTVRYTFTDANGCSRTATDIFTVIAKSSRVNIFPNPTSGNTKIVVTPDMIGATMEVYDQLGQKLTQYKLGGRLNEYYFPWAVGTYTLVFRLGNERIVKQVVIAR